MPFVSPTPVRPSVCPATLADFRAAGPSTLFVANAAAIYSGSVFRWDPASLLADDGVSVIKPDDIAVLDPGRWRVLSILSTLVPDPFEWALSGVYSAAIVPGFFDPPIVVPSAPAPITNRTCIAAEMVRRTSGLASSTIVDILNNGVSIFAAPANRLTLAAGASPDVNISTTFGAAAVFIAGDVIEARLDSVETFDPGPPLGPEGLRVRLYFASI